MIVDFPQPDGPTNAILSPYFMFKFMFLNTY